MSAFEQNGGAVCWCWLANYEQSEIMSLETREREREERELLESWSGEAHLPFYRKKSSLAIRNEQINRKVKSIAFKESRVTQNNQSRSISQQKVCIKEEVSANKFLWEDNGGRLMGRRWLSRLTSQNRRARLRLCQQAGRLVTLQSFEHLLVDCCERKDG